MAMKRRGFLRMFGAAAATPFLPAVGIAGPAAGFSNAALKAAIAHAKKFPVISVAGMSRLNDLSTAQSETVIKELASRGLVKLVGPSRKGTVRAASKIFVNDRWGIARTAQQRQADAKRQARQLRHDYQPQKRVAPWLAHLHDVCRHKGMTLSPRCFA